MIGREAKSIRRDANAVKSAALAVRVLVALSGEGASGGLQEEGAKLVIATRRKNISVPILTIPAIIANDLLGDGLAIWEPAGKSGAARLVLTQSGRAKAARLTQVEGVPPFAAQHLDISQKTIIPGEAKIAFDDNESPLGWLAKRKGADGRALIDPVCFAAGERFRADLTLAQMMPRVTANWSAAGGRAPGGGAGQNYSDVMLAARQRINKALDAVGPDLSGVLIDLCGFLKGLETIEREHSWPRRSAKVVLDIGLRRLARHYGLEVEARGPARSSGIAHWGTGDFRPKIANASLAQA